MMNKFRIYMLFRWFIPMTVCSTSQNYIYRDDSKMKLGYLCYIDYYFKIVYVIWHFCCLKIYVYIDMLWGQSLKEFIIQFSKFHRRQNGLNLGQRTPYLPKESSSRCIKTRSWALSVQSAINIVCALQSISVDKREEWHETSIYIWIILCKDLNGQHTSKYLEIINFFFSKYRWSGPQMLWLIWLMIRYLHHFSYYLLMFLYFLHPWGCMVLSSAYSLCSMQHVAVMLLPSNLCAPLLHALMIFWKFCFCLCFVPFWLWLYC